MKRAVALLAGALVLAAAAQAGQGIPEAIAARPRPHPAFGWFAQLDASCWSGRESNGGAPSVYCYRFVDGGRKLLALRPWDGRLVVESSITMEGDSLVWRSALADRQWQCVLRTPGAWGLQPPQGAVVCELEDAPSRAWPPGRLSIRVSPDGVDRFEVRQTYQFGGGAQGTSYRSWTFVRAAPHRGRRTRGAAPGAAPCLAEAARQLLAEPDGSGQDRAAALPVSPSSTVACPVRRARCRIACTTFAAPAAY